MRKPTDNDPAQVEPTAEVLLVDTTENITPDPTPSDNKRHIVWEGEGSGGHFPGKLNNGATLVLLPGQPVVVSAKDPFGVHPDYARELVATPNVAYTTQD